MKKHIIFIVFICGALLLPSIMSFKELRKDKNVMDYFLNPELGNINYRTYQSTNGLTPRIILKQIITENNDIKNGIQMEYIFMTGDSTPIYSGIENISKNEIEVLQQYLYINSKKIRADKISNNIWHPNSKEQQPISIEFNMKETGYSIKSEATTNARFKDTLGHKSFIVEAKSIITTSSNGEQLSRMDSDSMRMYFKNKGLVYSGEVTNGKESDYFLIENE